MRKTHGLYIDSDTFNTFSIYASIKNNRQAYKVWAEALTKFMKDNPLNAVSLSVYQQIENDLPQRKEVIQMKLLSEQIICFSDKLKATNGNERHNVKERLIQLLMKATDIKNPTEDFVKIMEEAIKLI